VWACLFIAPVAIVSDMLNIRTRSQAFATFLKWPPFLCRVGCKALMTELSVVYVCRWLLGSAWGADVAGSVVARWWSAVGRWPPLVDEPGGRGEDETRWSR